MAVIECNSEEYESYVASGALVLFAFWTEWSSDCGDLKPVLAELDLAYQGRAVIATINADQEGFLAMELGVVTLPTVILYHEGYEVDRIMGSSPASLYSRLLDVRLLPPEKDNSAPGYF